MTKISLPNLNKQGKANEWSHVEGNDVAIQTVVNGELDNENIKVGANIARAKLEGGAQGVAGLWSTPTIIATEETRSNVAFGTLPTKDEITGIVVPTNALLLVGYQATWKAVGGTGKAALFIGANQLKDRTLVQEAEASSSEFSLLSSGVRGLEGVPAIGIGARVTTGETFGGDKSALTPIFLAAGTYAISVQYKITAGTLTAKERKLWAVVLGF